MAEPMKDDPLSWLSDAVLALVLATCIIALFLAASGCSPTALAPALATDDPCVASCARRESAGCLEPALRDTCVPTCHRATAAKKFDPGCVLRAVTREDLTKCRVRCDR